MVAFRFVRLTLLPASFKKNERTTQYGTFQADTAVTKNQKEVRPVCRNSSSPSFLVVI